MADNTEKKTLNLAFWSTRFFSVGSRIAALFATRISRLLIVSIFIMVALYLSYQRVWQPILATAPLPPGVTAKSPQLNTDLLKEINAQRIKRVEAVRQQFGVEKILQPPPVL